MRTLWIPGRPVPWQRARYNRATGRFYEGQEYKAWKEGAGWQMKQLPMLKGAVALDLIVTPDGIHVEIEEISDNHRPIKKGMRGDLDNYEKSVLDAGNKLLFADDRQVVRMGAEFAQSLPA